eukprot:4255458-Amphidinium_carterae.2
MTLMARDRMLMLDPDWSRRYARCCQSSLCVPAISNGAFPAVIHIFVHVRCPHHARRSVKNLKKSAKKCAEQWLTAVGHVLLSLSRATLNTKWSEFLHSKTLASCEVGHGQPILPPGTRETSTCSWRKGASSQNTSARTTHEL